MAIKKRLIYADDLDHALEKTPIRIAADKVKMFKLIEEAPAVDAEIVVHGRWEVNTDNFTPGYRCSVCGYNKPMIAGEGISQEPMNYCNNCGADMRERKTDG